MPWLLLLASCSVHGVLLIVPWWVGTQNQGCWVIDRGLDLSNIWVASLSHAILPRMALKHNSIQLLPLRLKKK